VPPRGGNTDSNARQLRKHRSSKSKQKATNSSSAANGSQPTKRARVEEVEDNNDVRSEPSASRSSKSKRKATDSSSAANGSQLMKQARVEEVEDNDDVRSEPSASQIPDTNVDRSIPSPPRTMKRSKVKFRA
jgi:hypothetical protein